MGRAHHVCCISTPHQSDQPPHNHNHNHHHHHHQGEPNKTGAACICCIGNKHRPSGSPKVIDLQTKTPRARRADCCSIRTPRRRQASQGQAKMAKPRRWFRIVGRSFTYSSCRSISVEEGGGRGEVKVYNPRMAEAPEVVDLKEGGGGGSNDEYNTLCKEGFSREDVAAVTIQAYFRGHLARRAYKALKSLVRLQAVARGAYVRKQAEVAIHCMQSLVRLQVRVRARQMLTKSKDAHLLQNKETGTFLETYAAKNPVEVSRA